MCPIICITKKKENVMSEPVKFTQEELDEVKLLQEGYRDTIFSLGKLYLHRLNMEEVFKNLAEQEAKLQEDFSSFQKKEDVWSEKITKKYGEGNLNLEKGEFIPISPK